MYVVILAGGSGTRLWPLSRPERPKPFLPLLSDESLFQRTVARMAPLVAGPGDVYCVTDRKYGHLVREQAPEIGLLVEPAGRNTAAAIALATTAIPRDDDEVMVVVPADAWIADEPVFQGVLAAAGRSLATGAFDIEDPLVTLGIRPSHPSTDYGYLIPEPFHGAVIDGLTAHRLDAFEEKPTEQRARELVGMPDVSWNAGIFLWRRRAIWAALEKYTPLPMLIGQATGSELALNNAYDRITPISIDKAVMESAASDHRVVMAGMDVGWSDLGSWTSLLAGLADGDLRRATGRIVQSGEMVDTGPDDLLVRSTDGRLTVDTPAGGSVISDGVAAHLAGARHLEAEVRALVDRVAQQEDRA